MDASNYTEFKSYANRLFSSHGSSFGNADFDQIFDVSYSFYEEMENQMKRIISSDQMQLIGKIDHSCINPLWLKIGYLMFGPPDLTDEKILYSKDEKEIINTACSTIRERYAENEILLNCFFGITVSRTSKKAYHHIFFKVRNPDLASDQQVTYIDRSFRVYPSWKEFIRSNKLSPLRNEIFIPQNGRYTFKTNGKVHKEPKTHFFWNRVNEALSFSGEGLSATTAAASGACAIAAIATTAVAVVPPLTIAAGVLAGISGLVLLTQGIVKAVDRSRHSEKNPRRYLGVFTDLTIATTSMALSFTGVGLAVAVVRETGILLNVILGVKAVVTIGGGLGCRLIGNTIEIMNQHEKLIVPGLESQEIPDVQAMFSTLSSQYRKVISHYVLVREKFRNGSLTISDYLEFNCMLLIEFNVLDWKLTSSLINSDLNLPTCSRPRHPTSIKHSSNEKDFSDKTENPQPKLRLLNEKSAELMNIIENFRLKISELERMRQ
ncbi:hypothetical protein Ciccas_006161 [Cichlidogyrus casuarinus]|uniref:DUF4781 domain-containing protein n=1 Tax=Cichlidogyrus casuarinus TaxID=1844966 RepID=A0ABD2Q7R8_9PLAT